MEIAFKQNSILKVKYLLHKLLMLVFFTISLPSFGQGLIVFEEKDSIVRNYRYEDLQPPESIPNYLIAKMSHITAPTLDYFFGFTLYATQQIEKTKNFYRFQVKIDSIKSYNKLEYKGYTFDNLVFPNQCLVEVTVKDLNKKTSFQINQTQSFSITKKILLDTLLEDTSKTAYFLPEIFNYTFEYSSQLKQSLDSLIETIIFLENLKPQLTEIKKTLTKFQNAKPGIVRIYNIDLKKVEKDLQTINPKNKIPKSQLDKLQGEGLVMQYDSLVVETKKLRERFDNMMLNPHIEYFNDGLKAYQNKEIASAITHFQKAVQMKPDYPEPWFYFALIAFEKKHYDSCATTIIELLYNRKPDQNLRKDALILGNLLYDSLVENAENQISNNNLNEAIDLLETAIRLCNTIQELMCNEKAVKLMRSARQEMFNSWVSITAKSIQNHKIDLAINYLRWTTSFLDEHRNYISDSSAIDTLKPALNYILLRSAEKNIIGKRHKKALYYLNYSDSLMGNVSSESAQLRSTIQKSNLSDVASSVETNSHRNDTAEALYEKSENLQNKYENTIKIGLEEYENERFINAVSYFRTAKDLQLNTTIIKNDSLSNYLKKAGKKVVLADLKEADLQAWGARYDVVETMLRLIKNDVKELDLEADSLINVKIQVIENKLYKNKCRYLSEDFIKHLTLARQSVALKDYITAVNNWEAALKLSQENPDCLLDSVTPKSLIQHHRGAATYQSLIKESESLVNGGKDSLGFVKALEIKYFYKENPLENFGLKEYSIELFAANFSKKSEIQYFYLKQKMVENDFTKIPQGIKNLLATKTISNKHLELLKKSAEILAQHDFSQGKDPKTKKLLAQQYFPENKKLQRVYSKNYRN
ncbi:MAG: hypothetical protein JXR34_08590 [Bacteroidales bacterium]|nr:hypothetical protein [Bacteroidales bacterium]